MVERLWIGYATRMKAKEETRVRHMTAALKWAFYGFLELFWRELVGIVRLKGTIENSRSQMLGDDLENIGEVRKNLG